MTPRPLATTTAVALVSTALLVIAVALGWLGPDVGRGANFCEAARDGLLKQPANSLSNVGFVVAGLAVAWHAGGSSAGLMPRATRTAYACVVVLLGPASAAMHATQSAWGGRLDMLSMYLVAAFAASYALARLLGLGAGGLAATYVVLVALCEVVEQWGGSVPVLLHAGNLAFGVLLLVALAVEVVLWRRGATRRRVGFGLAALAAMAVALGVWFAAQHGWCDTRSLLQGHAAWHLLCAVAAYLLYRLYASEQPHSLQHDDALRSAETRPGSEEDQAPPLGGSASPSDI